MTGMRVLAFFLMGIKLLIALPLLVAGVAFGVLGIGTEGFDDPSRLVALIAVLVAIGLGFPFSLVPIKGFAKSILLTFAALPFCCVMALFPAGDLNWWSMGLSPFFWLSWPWPTFSYRRDFSLHLAAAKASVP